MLILKTEKQAELIVKKSRFIAVAKKCSSLQEVKQIVEETRLLHPNANHVVHAAVIGTQFSFSDDKEPKNTAGRPALEVLKGSGISNICVLIIRYFGGTLLGTGGLVKAYSDSTKLVLNDIETEESVNKVCHTLSVPYDLYENVKRIFCTEKAEIVSENFNTAISITIQLPEENIRPLQEKLSDLSNGKLFL